MCVELLSKIKSVGAQNPQVDMVGMKKSEVPAQVSSSSHTSAQNYEVLKQKPSCCLRVGRGEVIHSHFAQLLLIGLSETNLVTYAVGDVQVLGDISLDKKT
ncbi:hypothetical protein TNCV_603061 [Trichonephila clavipes]|nr:hypothetical protein TNCV_603061 [Trichonephila clavipes]